MVEEKFVLRDEELDAIAGGRTWICERMENGHIRMFTESVSGEFSTTIVHDFGMDRADEFRQALAGDTFRTADGKPFVF